MNGDSMRHAFKEWYEKAHHEDKASLAFFSYAPRNATPGGFMGRFYEAFRWGWEEEMIGHRSISDNRDAIYGL